MNILFFEYFYLQIKYKLLLQKIKIIQFTFFLIISYLYKNSIYYIIEHESGS